MSDQFDFTTPQPTSTATNDDATATASTEPVDPFDDDTSTEEGTPSTTRAAIGGVVSAAVLVGFAGFGLGFFDLSALTGGGNVVTKPLAADVTSTTTTSNTNANTSAAVSADKKVTITNVSPLTAAMGSTVTLSGTKIVGSSVGNVVKFGDTVATITNVLAKNDGSTDLTVTVPKLAPDTPYTISIKNENGEAAFPQTFQLSAQKSSATSSTGAAAVGMPVIAGIDPMEGVVGASVYIRGEGFDPSAARNIVRFASAKNELGIPAKSVAWVTVSGERVLKAVVPEGAMTGRISLTRDELRAESGEDFTIQQPQEIASTATPVPAPQITSFSVAEATLGAKVLIAGTHLTKKSGDATGIVVKFDSVPATIRAASADATGGDILLVEVPASAKTGYVTVEVGGQTAISPTEFTITTAAAMSSTDPSALPDVAAGDTSTAADTIATTKPTTKPTADTPFTTGDTHPAATTSNVSLTSPASVVATTPSADAPKNVAVTPTSAGIRVTWEHPAFGTPAGYYVYYGTTSGARLHRVAIAGGAMNATLPDLITGQRYYFAVSAVSSIGEESGVSSEIAAVVPNPLDPSFAAASVVNTPTTMADTREIPAIDFGLAPAADDTHAAAAKPTKVEENMPQKLSKEGPAETMAIAFGMAMIAGGMIVARRRKQLSSRGE